MRIPPSVPALLVIQDLVLRMPHPLAILKLNHESVLTIHPHQSVMTGLNHVKEGMFPFELFQASVHFIESENAEMEENKKQKTDSTSLCVECLFFQFIRKPQTHILYCES